MLKPSVREDAPPPRISFQKKLLFSYCFIILIPVLSALLIFGVHAYNNTKRYYQDFMNQLSGRADTITDEFITNSARSSYFYLTDTKLKAILEKQHTQGKREYLEDYRYMQTAMDQIVLMNGHITNLTISGLNGAIYNSSSPYWWNFSAVLGGLDQDRLYDGKVIVHVEEGRSADRQQVSIIRYLSDLNRKKGNRQGYVKVDINPRAIEKNFGGIEKANTELGTLVVANGKLIYNSRGLTFNDGDLGTILANFRENQGIPNTLTRITVNGESYLFTARKNELTGWDIIQFIPSRLISETFRKNVNLYAVICMLTLSVVFALAVFFSRHFFKPIHKLRTKMKLVDAGQLDLVLEEESRHDEIGQLVQSYNAMLTRLKLSRETELRAQRLQKRAELHMLQAQINPHFLYNTLNVIHSIAELQRVDQISVIAKSLANMYRYNLKSRDIVTIEQELQQIKNYINIQQLRFLDKHTVVYDIDEAVYEYNILKFLLQPLVENSFLHGLEPRGDGGTLVLSIVKTGHVLQIRVQDDGVGMSPDSLTRINASLGKAITDVESDYNENFGLRNICARIQNCYGSPYSLTVTSALGEGTCVELIIPAVKEVHEHGHSDRR
ncbi:cache domain-containing sensor histidine kinase [Paenibacillus xerothermodurans]|uniref:Sensor histidine kinase n=1 Tax=Paenibacillus xerothermodurans TaxID=1977292 RepID=A0A2W1NUK6_PAEXE|nr:histidine kinase [Paenibacillus xerothermodurans]PZE22283.1 sensor histidine kinase [Paenibacillus xerothermodurans]